MRVQRALACLLHHALTKEATLTRGMQIFLFISLFICVVFPAQAGS